MVSLRPIIPTNCLFQLVGKMEFPYGNRLLRLTFIDTNNAILSNMASLTGAAHPSSSYGMRLTNLRLPSLQSHNHNLKKNTSDTICPVLTSTPRHIYKCSFFIQTNGCFIPKSYKTCTVVSCYISRSLHSVQFLNSIIVHQSLTP